MKKILFTLIISLLFTNFFNAQNVPIGMKYQAVARNLSGLEISNKPISLKILLHGELNSSNTYYVETHDITTNEFGLFSLRIGEGIVEKGVFDKIPWDKENIWMEIAIKEDGDKNYTTLSNNKLLAVPYAYHANSAGYLIDNKNQSNNGNGPQAGVPSQNWSLFGNSKTNPEKDKLGTTDYTDLIFVTDNLERLKIGADGEIKIKGDLEVGQDLTVGRNVYLNANDTISPRGETFNYGKFTSNGQVTINPNLTGNDTSYDAYPLRIEGSNQGVAIKLNKEIPDNDNNFITFFNNKGKAVGRIVGETKSEKEASQEYKWEEGILIAEEVVAATNTGLSFIPVCTGGFIVSCGVDWGGVAMAAADLVLATLNLDNFYDFADANYGVTYQSGSADYAEWLERINPNEILTSGDIVGVFGGKISKYTNNAQQYMVISTKPAILGNMPREGQEKLYEKVAFMGQIPVKVRGPVMSGDYIIPSGFNDGIGRAVSTDDITAVQYREIVGVAWSSSLLNEGVSKINMAIGLNTNDVSKLVAQLEAKYNSLEARIAALENGDAISQKYDTKEEEEKTRYEIAIENMPPELDDEIIEEAMTYLKNAFQVNGIDIEDNPILHKLYTDPTYKAKIIKETQERYKITYQKYLEMLKAEN